MKELIQKWRDEAEVIDDKIDNGCNYSESDVLETEARVLRACANELEAMLSTSKPLAELPTGSVFHETVLHSQQEIKSALDFHKNVLLYFVDSPVPARVINVTRGEKSAVYVQHGSHFFWVRIGKSNVSRIVLHEMKLTTV